MLLGCIGDDFTGSSDLANTLAKQGMKTVQYTGVPKGDVHSDVEAGVIALKSRSIPVDEAVAQSLDALRWLKKQGCQQFFFKYCSTFDSTKEGNIGPVADALADELATSSDADCVVVCPAFPGAGRTLYEGHLFVNGKLLNESGMENHPLTPMVDADIRRWLGYQTKSEVGHVPASTVFAGAEAIREGMNAQLRQGRRLIVVDAVTDHDLMEIGAASATVSLITGGSGVALGLPDNFRQQNLISQGKHPWQGQGGHCAILAGSCSNATRGQIAQHGNNHPVLEIEPEKVMNGQTTPESLAHWLINQEGLPLAYTSADPDAVKKIQGQFGQTEVASAIENLFAEVARLLTRGDGAEESRIERLIVAGGETSGAVVEGLGLEALMVGPEIDPGVPAMRASENLVLTLKSGNFGTVDFFEKAANVLAGMDSN